MGKDDINIVICVDKPGLAQRLQEDISRCIINTTILERSNDVLFVECRPECLYIIETDDDVALLTQLVYELYKRAEKKGFAPTIIALSSRQRLIENPALGFWLIDGHAALASLWLIEYYEPMMFTGFLKRFQPS